MNIAVAVVVCERLMDGAPIAACLVRLQRNSAYWMRARKRRKQPFNEK